jgi:hypothetical protein
MYTGDFGTLNNGDFGPPKKTASTPGVIGMVALLVNSKELQQLMLPLVFELVKNNW